MASAGSQHQEQRLLIKPAAALGFAVSGRKGATVADTEKWLAIVRQIATGHHSKARKVWDGLNQNQRGLVLHAAGLKSSLCRYAWSDFNNRELLRLKRGIQRLSAIVGLFGTIGDLAFVQPKKVTTIPTAPVQEIAEAKVNALLQGRNQLRAHFSRDPY